MQAVLDHAAFSSPSDSSDSELMANAAQFAALEERVSNHIKFFWTVVAFGFVWMGAITVFLVQINNTVSRAETTRTTLTGRVVAAELGTLRATVETAQETGKIIPNAQLADYKQTLQQSPTSISGYWTTVAAIVNYQSFLDQINGHAPNPAAVSSTCGELTDPTGGTHSYNNTYRNVPMANRIVDLDRNTFIDVTFQNSVVRYHGNLTTLVNVRFVNCRFVLDIPVSGPTTPERNRLLMTLLNSPETKAVIVTTSTSS